MARTTKRDLSAEIVRELLEYDAITGIFTHKFRGRKHFNSDSRFKAWNKNFAGKKAGGPLNTGYLQICIFHRPYVQHRIAWLYVYGEWPIEEIDHINHIKSDNRLENLRVVTSSENNRNKGLHPKNKTGITGVLWRERYKKWESYIFVDSKLITLGLKNDFFEACCSRKSAEHQYQFYLVGG